jgi:hypothetical protein
MEFYTLPMGLGKFVFQANKLDLAEVATAHSRSFNEAQRSVRITDY